MENNSRKEPTLLNSVVVMMIDNLNQHSGLPSYTCTNKIPRAFYFTLPCYFITCILQLIGLIEAKNDHERLFECLSILAFSAMGIFKLFSLFYNYERWKLILEKNSKLEYELLNDKENILFIPFITGYVNRFRMLFGLIRKFYNFTLIIFILSPFLEYIIYKVRAIPCLVYPHILPGWNPLDNLSILGYLVTISCEFVGAVYSVLVHASFDLTVVGIMIFVCGQFSLLHDYCARIGGNEQVCIITRERDDRARFMIRRCHHIHLILESTIMELDKLLRHILGVYFLVATLTLCFVALHLKSENMSVMQLVSLLQYMFAVLTQLFVFCWYGDAVYNESSVNMGQGPFGAAYWSLSPAVRRELCMLGAGMSRGRHLRAGLINHLNLPSFVQVVRAAYSYYAVLGTKN